MNDYNYYYYYYYYTLALFPSLSLSLHAAGCACASVYVYIHHTRVCVCVHACTRRAAVALPRAGCARIYAHARRFPRRRRRSRRSRPASVGCSVRVPPVGRFNAALYIRIGIYTQVLYVRIPPSRSTYIYIDTSHTYARVVAVYVRACAVFPAIFRAPAP